MQQGTVKWIKEKNKFKINYMTWFLILFSLLAGYIKYTFIIMMTVVIHELGHIFFFKIRVYYVIIKFAIIWNIFFYQKI